MRKNREFAISPYGDECPGKRYGKVFAYTRNGPYDVSWSSVLRLLRVIRSRAGRFFEYEETGTGKWFRWYDL